MPMDIDVLKTPPVRPTDETTRHRAALAVIHLGRQCAATTAETLHVLQSLGLDDAVCLAESENKS
jgi:collagenase-like PrtC family protease